MDVVDIDEVQCTRFGGGGADRCLQNFDWRTCTSEDNVKVCLQ